MKVKFKRVNRNEREKIRKIAKFQNPIYDYERSLLKMLKDVEKRRNLSNQK